MPTSIEPRTTSFRSSVTKTTGTIAFVLVAIGAAAAACSSPSTGSSSSTSSSSVTATTTAAAADVAPAGFKLLAHDRHIMARPDLDVGRVDSRAPAEGSVFLKPSKAKRAAREKLMKDVQDPTSPSYHKWLKPSEYADRFGASKSDIAKLTAYLTEQGLTVDAPSRLGTRIGFHGTTNQVESAFNAEMHHYMVNGKLHQALSKTPSLPTEIAKSVVGIRGLHDFHPHASQVHRNPDFIDPKSGAITMAPADFRTLYDVNPLYTAGTRGLGVNLVVVGQTTYSQSDITSFRSKLDSKSNPKGAITNLRVPNTGADHLSTDDEGETELDLEWSSAVAPDANIIFVYTGSNTTNYSVDDAASYAIEMGTDLIPGTGNGGAQIISESYGGCEVGYPADADIDGEIASAANLEGITYIASSGDSGAAGCSEFGIPGLFTGPPASLPGVTAVGGTEFGTNAQTSTFFKQSNGAALAYPETGGVSLEEVWNDTSMDEGAGGGGKSILFPKPFWQQALTPADGARDVPDVALTASVQNVAYETYEDGAETPIGGTSASAPSFAAMIAMVNQAVAAKGGALGLGNINPMLYTLATSAPTAFHDIVVGNNDTMCDKSSDPNCPTSGNYGGYPAGKGYDLGSGIGTIDAANLVNAWAALAPTTTTLTASAASTTVNTPVTLTAKVASTGTGTMTGTVAFTFQNLAGAVGTPYAPDGGGWDSTWVLGTAPIVAGTGGGTATLTTEIPAGLYSKAYLVAMYGGDAKFMASVSPQVTEVVTGSTLAITPGSITLAPGQATTFNVTGGVPPVLWETYSPDTTCLISGTGQDETESCSQIESETGTEGYFQAGGKAGTVNVVAIDTMGQEATIKVTVTGAPVDGGAFPTFDSGATGGPGNGGTTVFDSGTTGTSGDAATGDDSGSGSSGDDDGGISLGDDDDDDSDSGSTTGTTHKDAGTAGNGASGGSSSSSGCATSGAHGTSMSDSISMLALLGLVFAGKKRVSRKSEKKA